MNEQDKAIMDGSERTMLRNEVVELLTLVKELKEVEYGTPEFEDKLETLYRFYDLIADRRLPAS